MTVKYGDWWRKGWCDLIRHWRFGFLLAGLLIFFEIATLATAIVITPKGMQWLGDLIFNATDYPVYLNYLGQGRTSLLVINLFKDLPQVARFDAFWSVGSLLVRLGLTPIITHEILRWLCTLILAFALYSTAKWHTTNERQAKISSLWLAAGAGSGWFFAFIFNLKERQFLISIPPDVSSSFAIAPTLTGGAHMILSLALQLLIARWIWIVLREKNQKLILPTLVAIFILACFHPYYIPLIGLICLFAWLVSLQRGSVIRNTLLTLAIVAVMLPSTFYYYWLTQQDKVLAQLYFEVNRLELHSPQYWLMSLLPILIAAIWLIRKKVPSLYRNPRKPIWAWIWILSAIICILLPFPWQAKYTQGLLPILTLLTLPFWLWITDLWLGAEPLKHLGRVLLFVLVLIAPFLYILFIQANTASPELRGLFYQPKEIMAAWQFIQDRAPADAVILSTDSMVNLWTPAYTLRRVWIGHGHATPNYNAREKDWLNWLQIDKAQTYNQFLEERHISYILTINATNTKQAEAWLDEKWSKKIADNNMALWERSEK